LSLPMLRFLMEPAAKARAPQTYRVSITFAIGKSIDPVPPPASMRILASSRPPRGIPRLSHASKCSESEICPQSRAVVRTLSYWPQLETPEHLEPPVPVVWRVYMMYDPPSISTVPMVVALPGLTGMVLYESS